MPYSRNSADDLATARGERPRPLDAVEHLLAKRRIHALWLR
jgi:hypothetical protein